MNNSEVIRMLDGAGIPYRLEMCQPNEWGVRICHCVLQAGAFPWLAVAALLPGMEFGDYRSVWFLQPEWRHGMLSTTPGAGISTKKDDPSLEGRMAAAVAHLKEALGAGRKA